MDRLIIIISFLALLFVVLGCQPEQSQYVNNGWSMRAAEQIKQQEMQDSYDDRYVVNFKLNEETYYGTGTDGDIDVNPVWEKSYAAGELEDGSLTQ